VSASSPAPSPERRTKGLGPAGEGAAGPQPLPRAAPWDPWIALAAAIAILVALFLAIRALWRAVGRAMASLFRSFPRTPHA
jgi:hypothetical protein